MNAQYRRQAAVVSIAIAAAVSAGCSSSQPGEATPSPGSAAPASARPTLTAAHLQPPSQDNKYAKSSGRSAVVVDPCTWIDDASIQATGFDPSSRRRGKDMVAEYTFLSCNFKRGDDEVLALESSNVSLDEVRAKYAGRTEDLVVNGRPAVKSSKGDPDGCSVDLQTAVGYLGITVRTHTAGRVKGMQPCDNIIEIATTLEPTIGKDN